MYLVLVLKRTKVYQYYSRKVFQPLKKLLYEGLTPHKLALSITFGIGLGIIPVFGVTTIMCLITAFILRLNKPAIVIVNFAVYPLQILLFVPFIRIGEYIFGYQTITDTFNNFFSNFWHNWIATLNDIWFHNLLGVFAWIILMIPACFILYHITLPVLKKFVRTRNIQNG